jgi:short-subunit dehydrogenase
MTPVMSAAEVARIGYQGLKTGHRVVFTGLLNRIVATAGRVSPRFMSLPIAGHLMSGR